MCTELKSCTAAEITSTIMKLEALKNNEERAILQEQFAVAAEKKAREQLEQAYRQLEAEDRLDAGFGNLLGSWQLFLPKTVTERTPTVLLSVAESNHEKSLEMRAGNAAALADVEKKLNEIHSSGKILMYVKSILRDAISIIMDLSGEFGKIEQFFAMLASTIDHIVMPKIRDLD